MYRLGLSLMLTLCWTSLSFTAQAQNQQPLSSYVEGLYSATAREGSQNNNNFHGVQEWRRPHLFGLLGKRKLRASANAENVAGRKKVTMKLMGRNGTRETVYTLTTNKTRAASKQTTYTFHDGTKLESRRGVHLLNGKRVDAKVAAAHTRRFKPPRSRLLNRIQRAARGVPPAPRSR